MNLLASGVVLGTERGLKKLRGRKKRVREGLSSGGDNFKLGGLAFWKGRGGSDKLGNYGARGVFWTTPGEKCCWFVRAIAEACYWGVNGRITKTRWSRRKKIFVQGGFGGTRGEFLGSASGGVS